MAKNRRKMMVCAMCAFCALALSLPCLAASAGYTDVSKAFLIVVDGDQFGSDLVSNMSHTLSVYNYHVPSVKAPYTSYIGLKFGTYPGFEYSATFTIGSGGEVVNHAFPLGVYMTDTEFSSIIGNPTMSERISAISDFYDGRSNGVFTTEFERDNHETGNESVDARFTWQAAEENTDFKVFCLYLDPTRYGGNSAFSVTCTGIKVSYAGSIDSTIVNQIEQTQRQLGELGVKVDTVINDVAQTQQDIANLKTTVLEEEKKTQDAINTAASEAHSDAKDTQDAIKDQPNNEYNVAQDKLDGMQGDVDDLQGQANIDGVTDGLFDVLKKFWTFLSSTDTQTHFGISPFAVTLPGVGEMVFWEGGQFDFSQWVNNSWWMYRLILLGKILSGFFMFGWAVRFVLDCIDFLLGNSKKSISQIIFGYNPFSR